PASGFLDSVLRVGGNDSLNASSSRGGDCRGAAIWRNSPAIPNPKAKMDAGGSIQDLPVATEAIMTAAASTKSSTPSFRTPMFQGTAIAVMGWVSTGTAHPGYEAGRRQWGESGSGCFPDSACVARRYGHVPRI